MAKQGTYKMIDDKTFKELVSSNKELFDIVESLQKQNAFLSEIIEMNNLGTLVSERRELLTKVEAAERKAKKANQLIKEYNNKIAKVENIRKTLDEEIDAKYKKRAKILERQYQTVEKDNAQKLKEYEKVILEKYKETHKIYIITTVFSVVFGIICLLIHFI